MLIFLLALTLIKNSSKNNLDIKYKMNLPLMIHQPMAMA